MAFRQIKSPALANQAVIETKLDVTAIKNQVAAEGGVSGDLLLMYSASGDALRKVSFANLIGSFSTDDLAEGTNLYFTDARAKAAVAQDIADAVAAEAAIARAAEQANATAIATEASTARAAEQANADAITAETTRASAAEATIVTNYQAADANLQTQINNILNNVDETALNSLAEIVTAFQNADNTLTAGVNANASAISAETAARIAADNVLNGLVSDAQAELDAAEAALGLAADGTFVAHSGTNYIDSATSFKGVDAALDAAIKVVADALATEVAATDGEVSALQAADVTLQGNIDAVAADLVSEAATARAAEAANASNIADEITARATADTQIRTDFAAADSAIQSELDATQAGAGLGVDGSYTAKADANYIASATTMKAADEALDAALKSVDTSYKAADVTLQGNIDAEETARIAGDTALSNRATTLETEMDDAESRLTALEAGTGGTFTLDTTAQTLPGGINEIHGEVDAIEARVTTNESDIATNAQAIANILNNTDEVALNSLAEIVTAFQDADSSLSGLISANATAISNEVTRATGAEATLQANIDSANTARSNADTVLQNNIDAEATTRANADTVATTDRAAIRSEFAAADVLLQGELDDTQAGAGLANDGSYVANAASNYITAASSLKDADDKLDAALKAVDTAYKAADSAMNTRVTTLEGEMDTAQADIITNAAAVVTEAGLRAAADSDLADDIAAVQSELDATQTGAGLAADGSYTANASANYIAAATSLADADNKLDAQVKTNADGLAAEITARENAVSAEASARSTADASLQTAIDNEVTARSTADATHTANIATNATNIATLVADLATETSARQTGDAGLQTELDNTQLGAGLAADGSYVAPTGTNYIDASTSLANADVLLDTAIKATDARVDAILDGASESLDQFVEVVTAFQNADTNLNNAITQLASDASTARSTLQTNLEAADAALNVRVTANEGDIASLQTFTGEGTALTTTATTLAGAINELNSGSAAAVSALQTEVDAIETSLGLAADGTFVAHSGSNYMDAAATAKAAREALDTALKTEADRAAAAEAVNAAAITSGDAAVTTAFQAADTSIRTDFGAADAAIQAELDATQTGAGLDTDGGYTANASANYISAATSLKDADNKLDAQAKANADAIVNEAAARVAADSAEATTRAAADVTLQGNIDAEATTRAAADTALNTLVSNLQSEVDATQTGAGLGVDGTYSANASANYIAAATSLKDADNKLDAAIKAMDTAYKAADTTLTTNLATEVTRATGEEARIEAKVDAEVTRATAADAANASAIQAVADDLAQELLDRAAGDTTLQNNINTLDAKVDNIISNTDPAALDSLSEIVTAFQAADSTLTGTVAANATAISDEESARIAADLVLQGNIDAEATTRANADTAATTDRAAIRSEFAAADATLQSNIDGKLALAGGTMSGSIAMGGNSITGLAAGSADTDAVNVGQMNALFAANDISTKTTDDLAEGSTNLYYTDARVRAAVSASGDLSYNSATGVFSVDTSKALFDLTDYVGGTDYTGMQNYILQVNDDMTGVELVDPTSVSFVSVRRQTIDGDGSQTVFALDFYTTQSDAMIFVGGVIQDPGTHYTIDSAAQTLTMVSAIPVGTQIVVIANPVSSVPYIETGAVTKEKLASDIKAYTQKLGVSAGTSGTVVDTFDGTAYRTGKYIIQVDNGAGEYETREALVVHDGTNAYITEYAIVYTGSGLLGDATVQMNGTDVELVYTANSAGTTVKVISTYIDV